MITDKKQDNRIQIKLDKGKYVVNLLICVSVDSGIRLLFLLSLPVEYQYNEQLSLNHSGELVSYMFMIVYIRDLSISATTSAFGYREFT